MIEAIIRRELEKLLNVKVYLEIPDTPPKSFIVFQSSGESKTNKLPMATFQFDSYAETNQKATELDDLLIDALERVAETCDEIRGIEQTSGSMRNNTITKKYRHSTIFDIWYY